MSNNVKRWENISFWLLVGSAVVVGTVISTLGLWIPGKGSFIDRPQEPGESLSLFLNNGVVGIMQAMAIVALVMRKVRLFPILLTSVALLLGSFVMEGLALLYESQREVIYSIDDIIRFGSIFGLAQLLMLPWIFPKLKWPLRGASHMAAGLALSALITIQGAFHLGLIVSGWGFTNDRMAEVIQIVDKSQDASELEKLRDFGIWPLEEVTPDNHISLLEREMVSDVPGRAGAIEGLWSEAPPAAFAWEIPGRSDRDKFAVIYDGRGATQKTWLLSTAFFNERRVYSVSVMMFLTGIATSSWTIMALLIIRFHKAGARVRHRKTGVAAAVSNRRSIIRSRLILIGVGGSSFLALAYIVAIGVVPLVTVLVPFLIAMIFFFMGAFRPVWLDPDLEVEA